MHTGFDVHGQLSLSQADPPHQQLTKQSHTPAGAFRGVDADVEPIFSKHSPHVLSQAGATKAAQQDQQHQLQVNNKTNLKKKTKQPD